MCFSIAAISGGAMLELSGCVKQSYSESAFYFAALIRTPSSFFFEGYGSLFGWEIFEIC
jgi:hypothetical protein